MRRRGALLPLVLFSASIKRLFCKISEGERAGGRGEGRGVGPWHPAGWGEWRGELGRGGLDGLPEPARGEAKPRTQLARRLARTGWAGTSSLPAPLAGLPWAPVPPPPPSPPPALSSHYRGSRLHPPPPLREADTAGARHICRISTEHSWVCPEPPSPKHKAGRRPRRAQTPETDTLTPLPTDILLVAKLYPPPHTHAPSLEHRQN